MNAPSYKLEKEAFARFVTALKAEGEVIAPKSNGVDLIYEPIERASEINLSRIPLDNPKKYVFPLTEKVLEVEGNYLKGPIESKKRVLFGVRPCDVAAFRCLKAFFEDYAREGKITDPLVTSKLKNLTTVAYNCLEPKDHCFCTATGTGPTIEEGFDLALTDIGDAYLIEVGSPKGEDIVQRLSLPQATSLEMEKKEENKRRCIEKMNVDYSIEGIENVILKRIDTVAEKYSNKCIACGGCNFFCPSCSCFNVADIADGKVIRREQFWDSCLYRGFTWLAGGVFERASIDSRLKNRILHKLLYTKEHYNAYSCTGCGRCSHVCPSYIYMEDMIQDLLGIGKEEEAPQNPYVPKLATVKNIRDATADVKSLTIEFDDSELKETWTFKPGQFVEVSAFGYGEVPISISSSPTSKGHFEVAIRNTGKVTAAFSAMQIGDKLGVRGPYGNWWPIEKLKGRNVTIVAGGIGLAAVANVLRYMIANRLDYNKIQLLYGAINPNALVFADEYEKWKKADVDVHITVDRREGNWTGNVGLVTGLFNEYPAPELEKVEISADAILIVCGPPIMINFACQDLVRNGFKPENIYLSLEGHMKCGIGKCGHCNIGKVYVCKDGPVFTYAQKQLFEKT
jgi:NAD(P)H-flavin reductase/formate hydrogenlyase subunit 6/NADH:ubiquinone oxidoreductase subunit I